MRMRARKQEAPVQTIVKDIQFNDILSGEPTPLVPAKLQIARLRSAVIQHNTSAIPAREEVLQRQDLPAVSQRVLRQQSQFRHGIRALHASGSSPRRGP